ncbi:MAG: hypothetical protein JRG94_27395 [Deltaproteobacteria bacterium]|nr:hypothetical protein [Deltaproteobacteria bacterium]
MTKVRDGSASLSPGGGGARIISVGGGKGGVGLPSIPIWKVRISTPASALLHRLRASPISSRSG